MAPRIKSTPKRPTKRKAAKRQRNYRAEYLRRLERAAEKGLSRSQARGHAKVGEPGIAPRKHPKIPDKRLQISLHSLKSGASLTRAAREGGISSERLRSYVVEHKLATKRGPRWVFHRRRLRWHALIYTGGQSKILTITEEKEMTKIAKYHNAIKKFMWTKKESALKPFVGKSVEDADGNLYPLETGPNALLRLINTGAPTFEAIYKLIPN